MASDPTSKLAPFRPFLELNVNFAYRQKAEEALLKLCKAGQVAGKGFDPTLLSKLLNQLGLAHQDRRVPGGELSGSRLRRIVKRTQELQAHVRELRNSGLVVAANFAGEIQPGDLLYIDWSSPELIDGSEFPPFGTLTRLPELARWYASEVLHGTDGYLSDLCQYIKTTTGRWHDKEVVEILHSLKIPHVGLEEDVLRMWRRRRPAAFR